MQLLCLGLSRSGTDSLRSALLILGYDGVYHGFSTVFGEDAIVREWTLLARRKYDRRYASGAITREDFDKLLGDCEATTDQPVATFPLEVRPHDPSQPVATGRAESPQVIEAYPEAKVLLNTRDVDTWHTSIVNTFEVMYQSFEYRVLAFFHPRLYWRRLTFQSCYVDGYFQGSMARNGRWVYKQHCAMIRGVVPPEKRLEWKVQDGWGPLCEFLGKPVPDVPFPNGNAPAELQKRAGDARVREVRAAKRNFAVFVAVVVAVLAVLLRCVVL